MRGFKSREILQRTIPEHKLEEQAARRIDEACVPGLPEEASDVGLHRLDGDKPTLRQLGALQTTDRVTQDGRFDGHFACPYSFNGRKTGLPIRDLR
jgi:hypothetical protein